MPKPRPTFAGLTDVHCHLDYPPMADDLDAALHRARQAGVERCMHIGCSVHSWSRAIELAQTRNEVVVSIGIHPHEAKTVSDDTMDQLRDLAASPGVVALGETGLDYHYNLSTPQQQRDGLARHVDLARDLGLPLVLHIRDAHAEALQIVRTHGARADLPGMVHCFTGGPDDARQWLDLGFHLSFSGIATFKKAEPIRDAVRLCPTDRILLETDAPYLAPVPVRGKDNEPANVAFTCAHLAQVRGEDPLSLARQSTRNAEALLDLRPIAAT